MANRRSEKNLPCQISPLVWGYIYNLKKQGVPIKQAWVFGSWAKGTQHKWSDIDLAIVSSQFNDWDKKIKKMAKAMQTDFAGIETHGFHPDDFDPTENSVAYEAIKYGIRII